MGIWPQADIALVHFRWCSLPVLVTLILCFCAAIDLMLSLKVLAERGIMLTTTGESISVSHIDMLQLLLQPHAN